MDKSPLSKICEKLTDDERKVLTDSKGWAGPEWFFNEVIGLTMGKQNG